MDEELLKLIYQNEPDYNIIPGGVRINEIPNNIINFSKSTSLDFSSYNEEICYVKNFINIKDCDNIVKLFEEYGSYSPVTVQGLQEVTNDNIGSNRITAFSPKLAQLIFENLFVNTSVPNIRKCNPTTPTDWWQGEEKNRYWEFTGVSPMLRFMKYEKGGLHFPHYDAGFIYPNSDYRTLKSFVLYLTTNNSGATRIINDEQMGKIWERDHSDWHREPYKDEIHLEFLPVKGDMLIFDHRICHDVSHFEDPIGTRIVIRGDLIYKKI